MKETFLKLIIITLVMILSACAKSGNTVTINFDSNGGTIIDPIVIQDINDFDNLQRPTKEGYEFEGWFFDNGTFLEQVDELALVSENITLYAKWSLIETELTITLRNIYNLAVKSDSFNGTYEEWIETVRGPQGIPGIDGKTTEFIVSDGVFQWRYSDDSDWTALLDFNALKGADGYNGKAVQFQINDGYVQWQYIGDLAWNNLVALSTLTGSDGVDGKAVTFQVADDYIQWQYVGDSSWINLIDIATLTGEDGSDGQQVLLQLSETHIQWKYELDSTWQNLISLDTLTGSNGLDGIDGSEITLQVTEDFIQWKYTDDSTWHNLIDLNTLIGKQGDSAYETYIKYYPDYTGTELDWINDLVNGRLAKIILNAVTFDPNNGTSPTILEFLDGETIEQPAAPTKTGYQFEGWYFGNEAWKFDVYPVLKDMTLQARYIETIRHIPILSTHIPTDNIFYLPNSVNALTVLGNEITVSVDWDLKAFSSSDEGKFVVAGEVEGYGDYALYYIHTTDMIENTNVVSGYINGLTENDNALVTLSNQYYAYTTDTDETGYYEFKNVITDDYHLKVELQGYMVPTPIVVDLTSNKKSSTLRFLQTTNSPIKHINIEVERFDLGRYFYEWVYTGDYFGYETSSYILTPKTIEFLDENVEVVNNYAAINLSADFNIILSNEDAIWSMEYASRLLEMFNRIPKTHFFQIPSKWILTSSYIDNDISIEYNEDYSVVVISEEAFKNAAPRLAKIDGEKGMYFSNRLYHAVVRYATKNGTDTQYINQIFQERFGVSIFVPDYSLLTRYTTVETGVAFEMFRPEELLALLEMFEEMPKGLHKVDGLDYLVRRRNGMPHPLYPGAAAVAWDVNPGYIEFMEVAFDTVSQDYLHRLIVHEKAHFVYARLMTEKLHSEWEEIGGWYLEDEEWYTTKTTEFVSAYAHSKNPNEDFAESVAAYLVNPDILLSRAPLKYEFIKKYIMHGTTYISEIRQDLTFEVLNLFPDYDYPGKIKRVTINVEGLPEEDKIITVEIELNDVDELQDGAASAFLRVVSEINTFFDMYLYKQNDEGTIFRGTYTMSKYAKNGYWTTSQITVTDQAGNQRFEGSKDVGFKLFIDNPLEDIDKPVLDTNSVVISQEQQIIDGLMTYIVKVEFDVSDNMSGVVLAHAYLVPSNYFAYSLQSYGSCNTDGTHCEIYFYVSDFYPNGKYTVGTISLGDLAGNHESFDAYTEFNEVSIMINTQNEDLYYPELDVNRIYVSATPTNPESPNGETLVTITYFAKDNKSGLGLVYYTLRDPQGKTFGEYHYHENFYTYVFQGDPTVWTQYTIKVVLPVGSAPGKWGLLEIYLSDKVSNGHTYNFTEIITFDLIN